MELTYHPFVRALPVWPAGLTTEMNHNVSFRAIVAYDGGTALVRLTGSTCYQVFINAELAAFGPARSAHDVYRVDEIDIGSRLHTGDNVVAIIVHGSNINGFYYPCQPSFVQAEVMVDGHAEAWTEPTGGTFPGRELPYRVRRVQRYSFQRGFAEAYRLQPDDDLWLRDTSFPFAGEPMAATEPKALLPRSIPLCQYPQREALLIGKGTAELGPPLDTYIRDRALTHINDQLLGYPMEELELALTDEAQRLRTHVSTPYGVKKVLNPGDDEWCKAIADLGDSDGAMGDCTGPIISYEPQNPPIALTANSYGLFEFGLNSTGFIGLEMSCESEATVYALFDEVLTDGDVDPLRASCTNVMRYNLQPGDYRLLSFEPYTMRYLKLVVLGAGVTVSRVWLTQFLTGAQVNAEYTETSPRQAIYDAAVETFRQNAADLFMDCPSRERAGWLCDSFFTARVEHALTGDTTLESQFLENYLLSKRLPQLPPGMLPMCYPADHLDGTFIPNWPLWLVLQLEEYGKRDPHSELVAAFRQRIYELLDYFEPFENADGLLERLEMWIFVEWSRANDLVRDVNYPTNMLYSAALAAAGRMYSDARLLQKAGDIARTVARLSFDGTFFTDNAVREDGVLRNRGESTEVCQYYAFYFDIATPQTHPQLWHTLLREFGPQRALTGAYPAVAPANSFIGNYLRMDLLRRHGYLPEMLREIEGYFLKMAAKTGTLWENDTTVASCSHGFASYIAVLLLEAQRAGFAG